MKTDIQVALAAGGYGRVAPGSVLVAKHFLDVASGVKDKDYGGHIVIVPFKCCKGEFEVIKSDPFAQLSVNRFMIQKKRKFKVWITPNGIQDGGFGSTGKN